MINLAKLFEMQKVLDDHIMDEHPELKGQNNIDWKILALLVEIGECANEWRGFKKWSDRQEPKHGNQALIDCPKCSGNGFWFAGNRVLCQNCNETGKVTNPLLEEFVDGLHFVLTIGIEIGFENPTLARFKEKTIAKQFLKIYEFISELSKGRNYIDYSGLTSLYLTLGEMIGFSWEEIEQAYFAKNAVNHERQANGY
jgi:dimeric dUTPase (all-alpha-NTP-PPase superfamily)